MTGGQGAEDGSRLLSVSGLPSSVYFQGRHHGRQPADTNENLTQRSKEAKFFCFFLFLRFSAFA